MRGLQCGSRTEGAYPPLSIISSSSLRLWIISALLNSITASYSTKLLSLQRFNELCQIVNTHVAKVLVPGDLMKDRSPHRHRPTSVRRHCGVFAGDDILHPLRRKSPGITLRNAREIRDSVLQRCRSRTIARAVNPMARGAIRLKQHLAIE